MPSEFFAGRRIRPAHELRGPRVYSTDLHPNHFSSVPLDKQIINTALSIKAKIITRGLVTINGAHFLSPQAIRFFVEHPDFIECPNIVTAFREDKRDFGDFVSDYEEKHKAAGINSAKINAHVDLLNEKVTTVLPWKLEDVGEKYRTLVVRGLQNPNSSIRHRLMNEAGLDDASMNALIQKLKEEVNLAEDRGMQAYLEEQSKEVQEHLRPFTTSCYHIIGVGVVNCETGTDLQPLADYKAEEMLRNDVEDSNYDEFGVFRRFFEIAMEAIDASIMPEPVLQALTFEDASRLGTRLHGSDFAAKYESVIHQFAEGLKQKNDADAIEQLDINVLTNDIEQLSNIFEVEIVEELNNYKTKYQDEKVTNVIGASRDLVGKGIDTIIPPIGYVRTVVEGAYSTRDLLENGWLAYKSGNTQTALKMAREKRDEDFKIFVDNAQISKKSPLLDAAALLNKLYFVRAGRA